MSRRVAFVLPVYEEEACIELFHRTLVEATEAKPSWEWEFIYVNDGSQDRTLELLQKFREQDERVTVASLSKNYGHQTALTAGLDLAHAGAADAVVIMDTDLQDPPEVAMAMLERWEAGAAVVYGQRRTRQDKPVKKWTAAAFYSLLARLSETPIPRSTGDFRVLDRKVLESVVQFREHDRFMRGIVASVGFRQEAYLFDRQERAGGETHYPLKSMLKLAGAGIFGFSTVPLKFITRLGFTLSFLAAVYGSYAAAAKFLDPTFALPGWTFQVVLMLFLSGVQLFMLGIIGSYVGRTYVEVLDRPLYFLESVARSQRAP